MKRFNLLFLSILLSFPVVSHAQFPGIRQLITSLGDLVSMVTIVVGAAALLVFLYGLMKFIFKLGGDEKAVDAGKTLMIWGVIGLFVMASVWGIVAFMQRELGLPNTTLPGFTQPLPATPNTNFIPLPPPINPNRP